MNAEYFAEWFRRQGHRVLRTASSYWYNAGPSVYQAFPYHWLIQPSEEELRSLMVSNHILSLRYSTPLDMPEGVASYHAVLYHPYNLNMLRHQARNGVRDGSKYFRIEQISLTRLAEDGWVLQEDTLKRQGRSGSMNPAEWKRICLAAKDLAGFEAWAAVSDGTLAGTLLVAQVGDTYCVPYAQSHRNFQNNHVNNILFFTVSCELLARHGVKEIFFTVQSLDAPPTVDDFKFRMGILPRPIRQRVVFHPLLQVFAHRQSHTILKILLRRYPEQNVISKAEGMLRFYLEGKRPVEEQNWPACLADQKDELLSSIKKEIELKAHNPTGQELNAV